MFPAAWLSLAAQLFVNTGQGYPLGESQLRYLEAKGVHGVRQDIHWSPAIREAVVFEFRDTPLVPLFVIHGQSTEEVLRHAGDVIGLIRKFGYADRRPILEVLNEPNYQDQPPSSYWGSHPEEFGQLVWRVWDMIRRVEPRIRCVSGGIGASDKRGREYLRRAVPFFPPPDASGTCAVGYHAYRPEQGPWSRHSSGFTSREQEWAALESVAGGRAIWQTEVGYHTAGQTICPLASMPSFCVTTALSEEEAANRLEGELEFNDRHGVGVFVIYKLLSGPDASYHDDNYGLLTRDGLEKESARRLSAWAKRH